MINWTMGSPQNETNRTVEYSKCIVNYQMANMNTACLGTRPWVEYDVLVCSLGRLSDSSLSEL